jgi:hypothetical protein
MCKRSNRGQAQVFPPAAAGFCALDPHCKMFSFISFLIRGELMPSATIKIEAQRLVSQLPDDATWEDLQYQIYFRQAVERGLADSQAGRAVSQAEAEAQFGLAPS